MKNWLRSAFKSDPPERRESRETASDDQAGSGESSGGGAAEATPTTVLDDLKQWLSANSPDPLDEADIDPQAHLYDAGYVTSITAAELLVHVEERYGVVISEIDLVGSFDNLEALTAHIIGE